MTKAKPEALNDSDSIAWQDTNCERNETSLSVLALFQELLRAARLRRRISTAMLAERAFISRATLYRAERGNPAVSIGTYATILWALGLGDRLADLAAPSRDRVGRALEEERLPQRIGRPRPRRRPHEPKHQ